jgi:hypothetical protein
MTTPPDHHCPLCGGLLRATSAANIERLQHLLPPGFPTVPRPNDCTICIHCCEPLVFNDDLTTRPADLNDLMRLDPSIQDVMGRAQQAIRAIHAHKSK